MNSKVSRNPGFNVVLSNHWTSQVAKRKQVEKCSLKGISHQGMDCISLLFAKGFPSSPAPKLPSCFFADCHWKQAIFHPHGGSTQECSGTADLGPGPCPHDPPTRASIPLSVRKPRELPFVSISLPPKLLGRNEHELWQRASPQGLLKTSSATVLGE